MKMNKEKLNKQIETMNKEQLLDLCKSTTNIIDDLQDRIDKAIEYINRNTCTNVEEQCNSIYLYGEYLNHLLDILRGKE